MRLRPLIVATRLTALAVATVVIAACGSTGASSPAPAGSPSDPAGTTSGPGTPPSAPSTQPASSSAQSPTRQTAITVVAPPTDSPGPAASPTGTTSEPVVTTTVTVTPTRSSSRRPATPSSTTRAKPSKPSKPTPPSKPAQPSTPPAQPGRTADLADMVVVIDPGHNGANAAHPEIITQQVPAGFGEHKNCNTTGTETNAGYPEYEFNWKVALAVRDALQANGITVIMTRNSNDGVGPCVNKRAAIGNEANADAVVSIHGDGEAAEIRGFYVMTASRPPAGDAMAAKSAALATNIRDGLADAGFPVSNALGENGLWTRSDLAGLNLSQRPTVMIECGNMRNATEAALMSSAEGQQRYAAGIAAGVVAYLNR